MRAGGEDVGSRRSKPCTCREDAQPSRRRAGLNHHQNLARKRPQLIDKLIADLSIDLTQHVAKGHEVEWFEISQPAAEIVTAP